MKENEKKKPKHPNKEMQFGVKEDQIRASFY